MTQYCMEVSAERSDAIVHTVSCGSFDLGSLLGTGNVFGLGNFGSSELALKEARKCHDNAIRCVDCCIEDLISRGNNDQIAPIGKDQAAVDLKHSRGNIAPPIRYRQHKEVPGPSAQTTTRVAELPNNRPRQLPAVLLA